MVIYKNKKKKNMEQVEEKQLILRYLPDSKKLGTEKSSIASTTTLKSKPPLHNFSLPDGLQWGNQRFLRCIKVDSTQETSKIYAQFCTKKGNSCANNNNGLILAVENKNFVNWKSGFCGGGSKNYGKGLKRGVGLGFEVSPPEKRSKVAEVEEGDFGINDVREKVILDLRNVADKMKDECLRRGGFEDVTGEVALGNVGSPGEEEREKPWNLRTRRAMNRPFGDGAERGGAGGGGVDGVKNLELDVIKPNVDALRTSRRSGAPSPSGEKTEREKFSVALGRREIEQDFIAMVGHKPPRRPKKRAKYVQKQLDTLFPGLWLTEITADMYKVTETG